MTSTIRVDNFGPSAGGTTYSARGIAKAWVNFNGTGTIAARDSENVSSLTDNGTGQYTINFSNAFGATDYAVVAGNGSNAAANTVSNTNNITSASSVPFIHYENSSATDVPQLFAVIHGDLA